MEGTKDKYTGFIRRRLSDKIVIALEFKKICKEVNAIAL